MRGMPMDMMHLFTAGEVHLALDVESGGLHLLDEMAWEIMRRQQDGLSDEEILGALRASYDEEEMRDALQEIREIAGEDGQGTPAPDAGDMDMEAPGVVKAMCLHVAHDCNLRCAYCFADTGEYKGERGLMSAEVGKKALDFLMEKSGNRQQVEVDFFGGEPLMNFPVIRDLVEYGRMLEQKYGKRILFTLTTNAIALTPEIADFANREMHNVVLSLDGRPEVHDRMRPAPNGKGSYAVALKNALRLVRGRGEKDYYVRGTYTHYNTDFTKDVLALSEAGFEQISVEPVVAPPDEPYALTEEDIARVLEEYETLLQSYLAERKSGRWFNFFHFMVDMENGPCYKKRMLGCGAGNEYVAISPKGDIYPCHQFMGETGYRMGSVLNGSFDDALQAHFASNYVQAKQKCRGCWAKYHCSGGCAANAVHYSGDLFTPYATECTLQKKRLECALSAFAQEFEGADA